MCHSCHTAWRSNTKTKDENGSEASKVCLKRNNYDSCVISDFCWCEALWIDASDSISTYYFLIMKIFKPLNAYKPI